MSSKKWTQQEVSILEQKYPDRPRCEILQVLPCRTWIGVNHKAKKLKIRRPFFHDMGEILPPLALTDFDRGYISGILDGEGFITLGVSRRIRSIKRGTEYQPRIGIINTNLALLENCHRILNGFGSITLKVKENSKGRLGKLRIYQYQIGKMREIECVLKALKPHLITKSKKASLLLKFIELFCARTLEKEHAEEMARQIHFLN